MLYALIYSLVKSVHAMLCYAMTLPQEWTEAWYLAFTICIEFNMICYAAP